MTTSATTTPGVAAPAATPIRPTTNRAASPLPRILLMLSLPAALAIGGGWYWVTGGRYVSTDNAYLRRDIIAIAPEVSGHIVDVAVKENQTVKTGQVLFRLDPEPFRIALAEADAALAATRLQIDQMRAAYAQAQAELRADRQDLDYRQREYDRQSALARNGYATQSVTDQAQNALRTAQQTVAKAEQGVASALAGLGGAPDVPTDRHPLVMQAQARRDKAALDLDHATLYAPVDGVVSQSTKLNPGQYFAAGTTAVDVVRTDSTYVEANYKETELAHITPGQEATVELDQAPDITLTGRVESIGAGTGSEFSLLPVENATGNWVKVVQRIPVRIRVTNPPASLSLHTGLSATAEVDTHYTRPLPGILKTAFSAIGLVASPAAAAPVTPAN